MTTTSRAGGMGKAGRIWETRSALTKASLRANSCSMAFSARTAWGEVKIADVAHGMRQTLQSVECRSSFEIQKDEMEGLRTMPNRQCHAPTDQQFGFPRACGPRDHGMCPDDARSIWNMPCSDMPMPFVGERTSQLRTMVRHMSGSLSRPCRCSKLMDGMSAKS